MEFLALFELFALYGAFGAKHNLWSISKRQLVLFFDTASILLRYGFDNPSQKSEEVSKKGRSGFEGMGEWLQVG